MKNIKNIALYVLTGMISLSCSEKWLEPEPLSFFTPENVYNNQAGLEALVVGLKRDLKEETHNTGKAGTKQYQHLIQEFAASDLASPWSQLDFKKLTPNGSAIYNFLNMFDMMFANIKNANVLINRVNDVVLTEAKKNEFLATGLWYRSYYYYRLVNTYGDVPFINEEITGAKLDFHTHSRAAILKKIQEDLEFAVQWLPTTAAAGDLTKGAANHLLTKVYLANHEYDKAIASATAVIDGPYALMTTRFGQDVNDGTKNLIWDLHRPNNVSLSANKETILATIDRFEAPADGRSSGLFTMRWYGASWFAGNVKDSKGAAGMISTAGNAQYEYLGRGNANVRATGFYQYDLWNYKNTKWNTTTDLRRADANWIDNHEYVYNNPASVDYGKPVDIKNFDAPIDTFRFIYAVPQYKIYAPEQVKGLSIVAGGNGDWYIFRLAETYLLRAEAYYWKNQLSNAAADINKVRTRAKALEITASEVNIEFILDERARELFAEEPRHAEMVRISYMLAKLNLQGYTLSNFHEKNYYYDRLMRKNPTYTQKINLNGNVADILPYHVLWPIPSAIITANTKGVINQNKGYDGAENNVAPLEKID